MEEHPESQETSAKEVAFPARMPNRQRETRTCRLEAVEQVVLETPLALKDAMVDFYQTICGMMECKSLSNRDIALKADRLQLILRPVEQPTIDPVYRRMVVRVDSVREIKLKLDKIRHRYKYIHGFDYTDTYLDLNDPAGYRIEIRRRWPENVL